MCISHFSKGSMWAKDPLSSRRRFIQSFPNERKNAFPCESGEGWEATSSGPSGHLPLSGEGFAWCRAITRTERKACPCEPVTSVTGVAPSEGTSPRERQDPHGYLPFCVCFWVSILHFPGNIQRLPQEEVRALVLEEQHRHPQQQLGVAGRVVQGQTEVALHPANPIEHRVPVSKKHLAGLFQRAAAG